MFPPIKASEIDFLTSREGSAFKPFSKNDKHSSVSDSLELDHQPRNDSVEVSPTTAPGYGNESASISAQTENGNSIPPSNVPPIKEIYDLLLFEGDENAAFRPPGKKTHNFRTLGTLGHHDMLQGFNLQYYESISLGVF